MLNSGSINSQIEYLINKNVNANGSKHYQQANQIYQQLKNSKNSSSLLRSEARIRHNSISKFKHTQTINSRVLNNKKKQKAIL